MLGGHIVDAWMFFGIMVAVLLGVVDDAGEHIVDAGMLLGAMVVMLLIVVDGAEQDVVDVGCSWARYLQFVCNGDVAGSGGWFWG